MMQDQPNKILDRFYSKRINEARRFLEEKYDVVLCDNFDSDVARIKKSENFPAYFKGANNFWKISVKCPLGDAELLIFIPPRYPDNFPRIYLLYKDFIKIYPIPHLDRFGYICTRDPEVVSINDNKSGEAILQLVDIALKILDDGISKRNEDEYFDELIAYWSDNSHWMAVNFPVNGRTQILETFSLSKDIFKCKQMISESEQRLEKWLNQFNVSIYGSEKEKILYIPVAPKLPLSVYTFGDAYDYLCNSVSQKKFPKVLEYYDKEQSFYFIICSIEYKSERMIFGWAHNGWGNTIIKGYRKGHAPLDVIVGNPFVRSKKITRFNLTRFDQERLSNRVR